MHALEAIRVQGNSIGHKAQPPLLLMLGQKAMILPMIYIRHWNQGICNNRYLTTSPATVPPPNARTRVTRMARTCNVGEASRKVSNRRNIFLILSLSRAFSRHLFVILYVCDATKMAIWQQRNANGSNLKVKTAHEGGVFQQCRILLECSKSSNLCTQASEVNGATSSV